jgi:hypothetical protein
VGSRIEHDKPLRIHADVLRHRLPLARIPWAPDTTQLPELIAGVSSTHVAIAQRLLYIEARLATDVTINLHMHDSATLANPLVWKLEIVWQRYGQNVYPTSEAVGEQRTI